MTRKKVTAAELLATLNADPNYLAKRQREESERLQREAVWREAEWPVVEALRAAGFKVESVWDLVNSPGPYQDAVPILLTHLPLPYPDAVREGIARALAVRESKSGWQLLTRLYRDEEPGRVKEGIAVAIAAAMDDDHVEDVIALARDTQQGASRLLLLSALERSAVPKARAVLVELEADPLLEKEIRAILRRLDRAK